MNKNLKFAILGILILFQCACATVKITSNKQADYNKKPKKIFIYANCAKEGTIFGTALSKGLVSEFANRKISAAYYVHNPLSLDSENDIDKKITNYNPEAVLFIRQTESGAGQGVYELTLVDGETKKNVWKSQLITSTDGYSGDFDILDKGVKTVLDKLIADGII